MQSAQRELNPRFRHGEAVGYRYIMGAKQFAKLSKIGTAGSHAFDFLPAITRRLAVIPQCSIEIKEHQVGLEPTLPHYECGVLAAGRPVLDQALGWRLQAVGFRHERSQ